MHTHAFPPLCPFGSTEDEHVEFVDAIDGSIFCIWSVTENHTLFLRVFTDSKGYVSYILGPAAELLQEPLALLPLAPSRNRRRVRRLLRRWGLSGNLGQDSA